jgi:hypothetical protein
MKKNIFVLGLDEFNLKILKRIKHVSDCTFHPLLHLSEIRGRGEYPVKKLIETCEDRLDRFQGSIDAVIGYFDFPSTDITPIICQKYHLTGASIESVMKCENKLWTRMEQQKVIHEHVPQFTGFSPEEIHAMDELDLPAPFWIKPVRSFRSYLAFEVGDQDTFLRSIKCMRENVAGIAEPFQHLLGYADIPDDFKPFSRKSCIAEGLISGKQCTLEGYVYNGEVVCYGIVDSIRDKGQSPLICYVYPSLLPNDVQKQLVEISTRIMSHIGYDNATFNIEFFYDPEKGTISLLEINPRCSQSHALLFEKVDGSSNLAIMVDLALGRKPEFSPGKGKFNCAVKHMVRVHDDGIITKIPAADDLARLKNKLPDAEVEMLVKEGTRLSRLENQDSYSFELMDIFLGGNSYPDLMERCDTSLGMLDFEMKLKIKRPQIHIP